MPAAKHANRTCGCGGFAPKGSKLITMVERHSGVRLHNKESADSEGIARMARLAGGVAHEFNNVLAVILLQADMLLRSPAQNEDVYRRAQEIKKATERAATLTRQLLAFGGKPVMHPQGLDLNEELEHLRPMLAALLGRKITLVTYFGEGAGQVEVDPIYLEQIISILATNARDAMPAGGQVTLTTEAFYQRESGDGSELAPGNYARITVADAGTGMDAETLRYIFEPFFTTKPPGKGIGLGLSTVYGLVTQMGGRILVTSEPGLGSSFEICLPRFGGAEDRNEPETDLDAELRGSENILLVDDEAMVRRATSEILEMFGYQVIEAATGSDAIEICHECDDQIDLLLTDISMGEMNGPTLAKAIHAQWPTIPTLFMSGDSDAATAGQGVLEPGAEFIEKPFTPEGLLRRIRIVLDKQPHRR
jgi:two-component system, cell cycle sensor histidine kinase and response regulator CckA